MKRKRDHTPFLMAPKIKRDSTMEKKIENWKRKRSNSEEDIILISSSDDDDDCSVNDDDNNNNDDVVLISDDSDSDSSKQSKDIKRPFKPNLSVSEKRDRVDFLYISDDSSDLKDVPIFIKEEKYAPSLYEKKDSITELSELSDDTIDLPDIPIFIKAENEHPVPSNSSELVQEDSKASDSAVAVNNDKHSDKVKENTIRKSLSVDLEIVKRNMFNTIIAGNLKENIYECSINPDKCVSIHSKDSPLPTGLIFQSLIETQIDNEEKLRSFALRLMLRTVDKKQYLNLSLCNLLVKVLVGSKELNVTSINDYYIGISILHKQLHLHPPCKPQMRQYYVMLCTKWFETILDKAEEAFQSDQFKCQIQRKEGEKQQFDSSFILSDLADVALKKERETHEKYLNQSKEEKLERITLLLKFFTDLFKLNTTVWSVKHWTIKCCPFRQDIQPLLSLITWTKRSEFGCTNTFVKKIFHLFTNSSEESSLHQLCGDLISLYAAIIQRWEKACIPHMGAASRDFARSLYLEIKNLPKFVKCFSHLHPDWLKFHVISFHLGVDQPANFYKMKEVILKTLRHIQEKRFIGSPGEAEEMCFQAIRSMMGMFELKSSIPKTCGLIDRVIEDDTLWFRDSIQSENISENIHTITIALGAVKDKTEYFYGFDLDL
ncbi:tRNA modification GTPase MnmE [Frankliniella fusca]|uniref:tRNA modification GTPase MnmE n=1 Tax=Frankliniella fusca TaxID=407009 RepID=A0AAE1HTN6_9NEOP|nr:tRNA modification GTPase MnmE [Frankliniella fusca]